MDTARVDALARQIIVEYGLPFELLEVQAESGGWRIAVRDQTRRVIQFTLPDSTAGRLRESIKARLDQES